MNNIQIFLLIYIYKYTIKEFNNRTKSGYSFNYLDDNLYNKFLSIKLILIKQLILI